LRKLADKLIDLRSHWFPRTLLCTATVVVTCIVVVAAAVTALRADRHVAEFAERIEDITALAMIRTLLLRIVRHDWRRRRYGGSGRAKGRVRDAKESRYRI
jgi:hypothetical protein